MIYFTDEQENCEASVTRCLITTDCISGVGSVTSIFADAIDFFTKDTSTGSYVRS